LLGELHARLIETINNDGRSLKSWITETVAGGLHRWK